jgi:hypothetical protein
MPSGLRSSPHDLLDHGEVFQCDPAGKPHDPAVLPVQLDLAENPVREQAFPAS